VLATDTARTAPGDPGPARDTAIERLTAWGPFLAGRPAFGPDPPRLLRHGANVSDLSRLLGD